MLDKIADKVYYINLDSREDRKEALEEELKKIGVKKYKRVAPVDKSTLTVDDNFKGRYNEAAKSLRLTTLNIVNEAIEKGYKSIIILEDDIFFDKKFNSYKEVFTKNIPDNWDMFFFGCWPLRGYPNELVKGHFRIRKCVSAEGCHAYMISEKGLKLYKKMLEKYDAPIDWITSVKIQKHGDSYAMHRNIAKQRSGMSDISGEFERRED